MYSMDAHYSQDPATTIVSILLMVGIIAWAIFNFRKANNGYVTLGEAVKIGAGISLVAGIITVLYTILLANVIEPDFPAKVMDLRLAEMEAKGQLTSDQIAQQKEMGIKFFWVGYPVILIINTLIGLVIGLLTGLILKKQKPAY